MQLTGPALAALAMLAIARAALPNLVFGTDWLAEAERGGFYHAVARGFYGKHGLDVPIRKGGPSINALQNLAVGLIDFKLSSRQFRRAELTRAGHSRDGNHGPFPEGPAMPDRPSRRGTRNTGGHGGQTNHDLGRGAHLLVAFPQGRIWVHRRPGPPLALLLAPFVADPKAVVQGFVTSEACQAVWYLRLPAALPCFLGGLRIVGGLSLIGAAVAEFTAGTAAGGSGLVRRILESSFRLDVPRMYAALFLVSFAGVPIFGLLSLVSWPLLHRRHESARPRER